VQELARLNKLAPIAIIVLLVAVAATQVWRSIADGGRVATDGQVSEADLLDREETTTSLTERTFISLAPLPQSTTTEARRPTAAAPTRSSATTSVTEPTTASTDEVEPTGSTGTTGTSVATPTSDTEPPGSTETTQVEVTPSTEDTTPATPTVTSTPTTESPTTKSTAPATPTTTEATVTTRRRRVTTTADDDSPDSLDSVNPGDAGRSLDVVGRDVLVNGSW
jgi:hypothetical protein